MANNSRRQIQIATRDYGRHFLADHFQYPATIVEVNGSTSPSNQPNMVWIRQFGQNGSQYYVLNDTTLNVAGTPVWVGRDPKPPFREKILGVYVGGISSGDTTIINNYNIGPHATTHQVPSDSSVGSDPVYIFQAALMPLKCVANGDLTVTIHPLTYNDGTTKKYFGGQIRDLSGNVPAFGYTRKVLIYLDPSSNTIKLENGTDALLLGGIVTNPDMLGIPSALVQLSFGQTAITTIEDVRSFLHVTTTGGSSGPYTATAVGQVLYSIDGTSFQACTPITSLDDGWLVNGDGTLLVAEG